MSPIDQREKANAVDAQCPMTRALRRASCAMSWLLSWLATDVLVALGLWLLGGIVLRVGGVLLVAGGAPEYRRDRLGGGSARHADRGSCLARGTLAVRGATPLFQLAPGAAHLP
jgi:hypothetical protein